MLHIVANMLQKITIDFQQLKTYVKQVQHCNMIFGYQVIFFAFFGIFLKDFKIC